MKKIIIICFLIFFMLPTFAKSLGRFGLEDTMHKIQELPELAKNEGDGPYQLAYWTQTRYFMLGIYMTKKGYVLNMPLSKKFLPLDDKTIAEMQQQNLLPTPLPEYKLGIMDYLIGYSLWIMILVTILWTIISNKLKRKD